MAKIALFTLYDDFALGIRTIASFLEENGHTCDLLFFKRLEFVDIDKPQLNPNNYEILNACFLQGCGYDTDPWTKKEKHLLLEKFKELQPDIIGLSTRNFIDNEVALLLNDIRKICPNSIIISGGFGPTFKPEFYAKNSDFVVCGEGELSMLEIANAFDINDLEKIKQIKNVGYFENGSFVQNPIRPLISLEELPVPKVSETGIHHIFNNKITNNDVGGSYTLLVGRGCVMRCSYCCTGQLRNLYRSNNIVSKLKRDKSIETVINEIRIAVKKGYKYFFIADPYLVGTPSYIKNFFVQLKKENFGINFAAQFEPTQLLLHPEILDIAMEAGLRTTVIGIQSGSKKFSKEIYNRNIDPNTILKFARLCAKYKGQLQVQYHFIFGNPLETEESLQETFELVKQLATDPIIQCEAVGCHRLFCFPNTQITDLINEQGVEPCSPEMWLYQATLCQVRLRVEDDEFGQIRNNQEFKENPLKLLDHYKSILNRQAAVETNQP